MFFSWVAAHYRNFPPTVHLRSSARSPPGRPLIKNPPRATRKTSRRARILGFRLALAAADRPPRAASRARRKKPGSSGARKKFRRGDGGARALHFKRRPHNETAPIARRRPSRPRRRDKVAAATMSPSRPAVFYLAPARRVIKAGARGRKEHSPGASEGKITENGPGL